MPIVRTFHCIGWCDFSTSRMCFLSPVRPRGWISTTTVWRDVFLLLPNDVAPSPLSVDHNSRMCTSLKGYEIFNNKDKILTTRRLPTVVTLAMNDLKRETRRYTVQHLSPFYDATLVVKVRKQVTRYKIINCFQGRYGWMVRFVFNYRFDFYQNYRRRSEINWINCGEK